MIKKLAIAATAMIGFGGIAHADEVWTSNLGRVVYEDDVDGYAVLSMTTRDKGEVRIYIAGLGLNYDQRGGLFTGYWISETRGDNSCTTSITAADGRTSDHWGQVHIDFDTDGFPTGFNGLVGECTNVPSERWIAEPVLG
jgi:hypothetical protein